MLITSAGVSKGDYDMVKDVLGERGQIDFWSVRMRPAKPLAFGVLDGPGGRKVPHLGLPGNPVSALVAFEQFGRAAISKMMGKGEAQRPTVQAVLEEPIYNNDSRRVYAPGGRNEAERHLLRPAHRAPEFEPAHVDGPRQRACNLPRRAAGERSGRRSDGSDDRLAGGCVLVFAHGPRGGEKLFLRRGRPRRLPLSAKIAISVKG